jgi:hypothetical protein
MGAFEWASHCDLRAAVGVCAMRWLSLFHAKPQFRALIGAVKVLGKLVDVRIFEANSIQNLLMKLKVEAC